MVHNTENISQKAKNISDLEWTETIMISTGQDVESQLCSSQELNMKNIDEEIKKQKQHQVIRYTLLEYIDGIDSQKVFMFTVQSDMWMIVQEMLDGFYVIISMVIIFTMASVIVAVKV